MKRGPKVKEKAITKTKLIKLRVTAAEHDIISNLAAARGVTISDMIRMAVFPKDGVNEEKGGQ